MMERTALEVTWVIYDPEDPFGAILALITLSPVYIMVMYGTLVVFQRDLDNIFMLIGQLTSEGINKVLKTVLKQERPSITGLSGHGMPSSHAQFLGFFAAYVVLYTLKRMSNQRRAEKVLTIIFVLSLAATVAFSRVHLGYHYTNQVVVGLIVGVCLGVLWEVLMSKILRPYVFPKIAATSLARAFYIRDITSIPSDLVILQYEASESQKKTQ